MISNRQNSSLRYYHFGATLLAIAIAALATYLVFNVQTTTTNNYKQTQCNQGLLILATMGDWTIGIDQCSAEIRSSLREEYDNGS